MGSSSTGPTQGKPPLVKPLRRHVKCDKKKTTTILLCTNGAKLYNCWNIGIFSPRTTSIWLSSLSQQLSKYIWTSALNTRKFRVPKVDHWCNHLVRLFLFPVLGIKPRISHFLGKCSITELHSKSSSFREFPISIPRGLAFTYFSLIFFG